MFGVVLTEGLLDWLVLSSWNYPACATLGGHGLERVVKRLEGVKYIFLAFDADTTGKREAETIKSLLSAKVANLSMPEGVKDVADLANVDDGQQLFHRILTEAIDIQIRGENGR